MEYILDFMKNFDNSELDVFAVKDGRTNLVTDGMWGNCKRPNYTCSRKVSPEERRERGLLGYRVSCFIKGGDFPRPARKDMKRKGGIPSHAGSTRIEYYAEGATEALIWLMGHEYAHYLACSGNGNFLNDEKNMDMVGYDLLHAYRRGVSPHKMALNYVRLSRSEPLRKQLSNLPSSYPYLRR